MLTGSRREHDLIDLFLSAYEKDSWRDCGRRYPEKEKDGAVEIIATRKSDGRTLAIEHTLVQPFVGEKEDFFQFHLLLEIERDESLLIPGFAIYVDVPVGALRTKSVRNKLRPELIVERVHHWLKENIRSLPLGHSEHECHFEAVDGKALADFIIKARVVQIPRFKGKVLVRRWVGDWNCGDSVEKALRTKLPKLVNTEAVKRILLLERDNMRLSERMILEEAEKRRAMFQDLSKVDEIWFADTMAYDTENTAYFWLHDSNHHLNSSLGFHDGRLVERYENGMPMPLECTTESF